MCLKLLVRFVALLLAKWRNKLEIHIEHILHNDMNLRRVSDHIVPRKLTTGKKQERSIIAHDLIFTVDADPDILKKISTGD